MAAMSTNGNDFFNMFFILLSYFQVVILFRSFYSKVQRYKKIENGNEKMFFYPPHNLLLTPFCVLVPYLEERLGDTVHILVAADVPLDGVGHMALQGFQVVDPFGGGQQSPAETFAAETSGIKVLDAVIGVLGEVDGALEVVFVDDIERPPEACEVQVVDVNIRAAFLHMLEIP